MSNGYKTYSNKFSTTNNIFPYNYIDTIINEDSLLVLKKLPDNCVDLVFTSPPYNFDMEYDTHKDDVDWNVYFDTLWEVFDQCIRVIKFGGRIIVNIHNF